MQTRETTYYIDTMDERFTMAVRATIVNKTINDIDLVSASLSDESLDRCEGLSEHQLQKLYEVEEEHIAEWLDDMQDEYVSDFERL